MNPPDTGFSRDVVINQTLSKVTRMLKGTLVVLALGLIAAVLWERLAGPEGPEWLSAVASGFAGGIGLTLALWARVSQLRPGREGS